MPNNPLGPRPGGNASSLNVAAAKVVKGSPGTCCTVTVIVAGSAAGAMYDADSTSGNTVADQFAEIPNTAGAVLTLNWPCSIGIVAAPGTGQTIAVAFA